MKNKGYLEGLSYKVTKLNIIYNIIKMVVSLAHSHTVLPSESHFDVITDLRVEVLLPKPIPTELTDASWLEFLIIDSSCAICAPM